MDDPKDSPSRVKTPSKAQVDPHAPTKVSARNLAENSPDDSAHDGQTVLKQTPKDNDKTRVAPSKTSDETTVVNVDPDATELSDPNATELSDAPITKVDRLERTPRPQHGKPPRHIDVGSTIRRRFVMKEVLGRGGMGAVFRALDLIKHEAGDDNPYVAIKLLAGDFQEHPHAFVTLQREAKKTQDLAHPNIVTVYDFDKDDDVVYLTMEQLNGAPLLDVIRGDTDIVLDDKKKLDIIEQIARGLAYAHSKGIVHSDLKPANLFLTDRGVVKILDFGIARAANSELYQDSFDAGELGALTLSYASPEMIRFESPHPSDDIYALGIIICELLQGSHPFDRKDAKTAFEDKLTPKLPDVKNPFLRKTFQQTLALERQHRTEDAATFLKQFVKARSAPKRLVTLAAAIVIGLAANFFYIQTIEVEEIPFSDLTAEQQSAFHALIEEGNTALKFQDLQEAVEKFNAAYQIHTSHKDMVKSQKKIYQVFETNLKNAQDEKSKAFFQSQLDSVKEYPAFSEITSNIERTD